MQIALLSLSAILGLNACTEIEKLEPAPIFFSGSVGDTVRTRESGDRGRTTSNQITGEFRANTHIYQPWLATVDTDLAVGWDVEQAEQGTSNSLVVSGSAALSVLPLSKYPTTISYVHSDSRTDGTFIGSEFIRDRVQIHSAAILPSNVRAAADFSYDSIEQSTFGSEQRMEAAATVSKTFTQDVISGSVRYITSDFSSTTEDEEDSSLSLVAGNLRWDSRPFDDVTVQSDTHLNYIEETEGEATETRLFSQGLTTARWQPDDLPFTVSGALRTFAEFIEFDDQANGKDGTQSNTQLISATVGLNYPIIPGLNANVGVDGTYRSIERDEGAPGGNVPNDRGAGFTGGVLGSIHYLSLPEDVLDFKWRWNAGAAFSLDYETDGTLKDNESIHAGHSGDLDIELPWLGLALLGLSQRLSLSRTEMDGNVANVSHQASLLFSSAGEGESMFARVSLIDDRDLSGERPESFQLAQVQVSRNSAIDVESNWNANFTLQATRRVNADDEVDFFGTANGTISYFAQNVFGVPNLFFGSELSASSSGIGARLVGSDEDDEDLEIFRADWRNKLRYRIGKIYADLEGTVFQENGQIGNLFYFRVRRDFGGDGSFF